MRAVRITMLALFALVLALPASTAWGGEPPWPQGWDEMDRPDLMDVREAGRVIYDSNAALQWDAFSSDNQTSSRMSASAEDGTAAGYFTGMTGNLGLSSWTGNQTSWGGYFYTDSGDRTEVTAHWYMVDPTSEWSGAVVNWWIFEPDLVKRTSQKTLLVQQAYLAFEVALDWHVGEGEAQDPPYESWETGVEYYGTIESCGAVVMVKDMSPHSDPSQADAENCADFAVWAVACRQPIADVLATLRDRGPSHGVPGDLIDPTKLDRVLELVGQDFARPTLLGSDGDHVCDPLDDQKWWMWGRGGPIDGPRPK